MHDNETDNMSPNRVLYQTSHIHVCYHSYAMMIWFLYRVYPYLCRSVRNYARDRADVSVSKEYYVAFEDIAARHK